MTNLRSLKYALFFVLRLGVKRRVGGPGFDLIKYFQASKGARTIQRFRAWKFLACVWRRTQGAFYEPLHLYINAGFCQYGKQTVCINCFSLLSKWTIYCFYRDM